MSEEKPFTPRLGRIRDQGVAAGKRLSRQLNKAGAKLSKAPRKLSFTGARYGKGGAARTGGSRHRYLSRAQMRRVIVKVHIARARGAGPGLFRAHVSYLQRDGVDREGEGGILYDRDQEGVSPREFLARSEHDRHQFRIIVSPEYGARMGDLKLATRELMARMERDTGRRLDWVAVDHHNTGHPHTHIVVRGRDARMKDVVIARDYLTKGLREAAEELATQRHGPRRTLEIANARQKQVDQDRWTGLDREIETRLEQGRFVPDHAGTSGERFDRSLRIARVRHLESLGLAKMDGALSWQMNAGWQAQLKRRGLRGDIVRTLAAEYVEQNKAIRFVQDRGDDAPAITGIVKAYGPEDELRDTRYLLVEDFKGGIWHVPSAAVDVYARPPRGAVVELSQAKAMARASDKAIALIAEQTGGIWSEDLHARHDPGSKPAYRLSLKRRLEALRRAGIGERLATGEWHVDERFLERAGDYEARASGCVRLNILSWLSPETQIDRLGETWVDSLSENEAGRSKAMLDLKSRRQAWLRAQGHLAPEQTELDEAQRTKLCALERKRESEAIAARSGRSAVQLSHGDRFEGKLEGHVDLAAGRMAIIGNAKEFALVPWRSALGRQMGRELTIRRTASGIGWNLDMGRSRGLSR
jgi:type IV secretory pathway VirD2 relaxase